MRTIIICFIFITACTGQTTNSSGNEKIAQQMFEAFNRHDWKSMSDFYASNALFLDPEFGKDYVAKSRQETISKYSSMEKMFPDIHDEIVGVYPSGDRVTIEFLSTGTAPDSSTFRLPIVTVLTFRDGVIVKDATYYDLENP